MKAIKKYLKFPAFVIIVVAIGTFMLLSGFIFVTEDVVHTFKDNFVK